jgi:hypothetical protein
MSPEEHIKTLCARAITADGADFDSVTAELQAALKAHIEGIRHLAVVSLLNPPAPPTDLPQA